MKIIFSDRENQHLHATPATVRLGSAHRPGPHRQATFPQVGCKTLTNSRVRGNLLIKYENMILVSEEAVCVCPRCRRTSGTTMPAERWPACFPKTAVIRATQAICCPPWS